MLEVVKPEVEEKQCLYCRRSFKSSSSGICPECLEMFDTECVQCHAQCMAEELDEEGCCEYCRD